MILLIATLLAQSNTWAAPAALPTQPTAAAHPGSAVYSNTVFQETFTWSGRKVEFFAPAEAPSRALKAPLIVFGHGQAIDSSGYRETIQHLVKKGAAVLFPAFDSGFFDQDWKRMARDFTAQTQEALKRYAPYIDPAHIVYAGHSKGGYVGLMAASLDPKPSAAVFFAPAGYDREDLRKLAPEMPLTLVWGTGDSVVNRSAVDEIFRLAPSTKKQMIDVATYRGTSPDLEPGHFFPLSKKFFFGGRDGVSPHHYFGTWGWLLGAAFETYAPYLYGEEALATGVDSIRHTVTRIGVASQGLESVLTHRKALGEFGTVAYRPPLEGNTGEIYVLFQGIFGGSTHRHMKELREGLDRSGARVYTLDLPGTGESDSPKKIVTIETIDRLVESFLRDVVGQPSWVIAEQVLGISALEVSKRSPSLLKGAILISPTGTRYLMAPPSDPQNAFFNRLWDNDAESAAIYADLVGEKSARFYLNKLYLNPAQVTDERVAEITLTSRFTEQRWLSICFVGGKIYRTFEDATSSLSIPVLAIFGDQPKSPTSGPPETVDLFQAVKPESPTFKYRVIEASAGLPHREQSESVLEAITSFTSARRK